MDCLIYFAISWEQGTALARLTLASLPAEQSSPLHPCKSQSAARVSPLPPLPDLPLFSPLHRFYATWRAHSKSYSSLTAATRNPGPSQPVSNCASHPVILLIPAGPANRSWRDEMLTSFPACLLPTAILPILQISHRIRGKIRSHLHGNVLGGIK